MNPSLRRIILNKSHYRHPGLDVLLLRRQCSNSIGGVVVIPSSGLSSRRIFTATASSFEDGINDEWRIKAPTVIRQQFHTTTFRYNDSDGSTTSATQPLASSSPSSSPVVEQQEQQPQEQQQPQQQRLKLLRPKPRPPSPKDQSTGTKYPSTILLSKKKQADSSDTTVDDDVSRANTTGHGKEGSRLNESNGGKSNNTKRKFKKYSYKKNKLNDKREEQQAKEPPVLVTLGDYLEYENNTLNKNKKFTIPKSPWIHIDNISPISSLDSVITAVQNAIHFIAVSQNGGILDLDATWNPNEPLPFIRLGQQPQVEESSSTEVGDEIPNSNTTMDVKNVIKKAMLVISPFARPTGWYVQLANRSYAYALLLYTNDIGPLHCAWKVVRVQEYNGALHPETGTPVSKPPRIVPAHAISPSTVRVENCPDDITVGNMVNVFSRYDLSERRTNLLADIMQNTSEEDKNTTTTTEDNTNDDEKLSPVKKLSPVVQWNEKTPEGRVSATPTFLVHFANEQWARSAVREMQSRPLRLDEERPLRLIQFPRQML